MDAVEVYLKQVGEIHASGAAVAETSPALQSLLNEIGADLKPRVRCIVNPANRGAGIPDIGLYTTVNLGTPMRREDVTAQEALGAVDHELGGRYQAELLHS